MFKFINRRSIKTKLTSAFLFCSICLIAVGGLSYLGLRKTVASYDEIARVTLPKVVALSSAIAAQKDVVIQIAKVIGQHASAPQVQELRGAIAKIEQNFETQAKAYTSTPFTSKDGETMWTDTYASWEKFKIMTDQVLDLSATGSVADEKLRDDMASATGSYQKQRVDLRERLAALTAYQVGQKDRFVEQAEHTSTYYTMLNLVVLVLGSLTSLLVGYAIAQSLSKNLQAIAGSLATGADEVASASGQISSSSQELSAAASEQAASLEETAASIEEMSSMVNKTSENATNTASTSVESKSKAEEGQEVVEQMIRSMDEINQSNQSIMQQVNHSNGQIADIVKVIQEIGNKTKVINDIVFQTKLLSFNASVEAARAGEHGKGFAVVAEEVGNLAQMSGNAAKEISTMLEGSIQKVENIVQETKQKVEALTADGKRKVDAGSSVARQCGEVLAEIVSNISSVNNMAAEISTASREQAQGVQEITKAMSQLDQVTQQNASASEQVASAAEELSAQAEAMKTSAAYLDALIKGGDVEERIESAAPRPPKRANRVDDGSGQVVQFRQKQKKSREAKVAQIANGNSSTPSFDHPGFKEV